MTIAEAIRPFTNPDCPHCCDALDAMAHEPRDTNIYAGMNMTTYKYVPGYTLRPDRNSQGYITHWHVCINEEDSSEEGSA